MKRILLVAISLLLGVATLPSRADDAARRKLASELLDLMKFERNMEQSFAAARQIQMAQVRAASLSRMDEKAAVELRKRSLDLLERELSWKNLKEEFVTAYAEVLTEQELKDLIAFYESPSGRAYVEKVPELMKRSANITQTRMASVVPQVQELVKESAARQTNGLPVLLPKP